MGAAGAVAAFNEAKVAFVAQLGDLIDGAVSGVPQRQRIDSRFRSLELGYVSSARFGGSIVPTHSRAGVPLGLEKTYPSSLAQTRRLTHSPTRHVEFSIDTVC